MTDRSRTTNDDRTHDDPADRFGRREFVALGAGASATMLAGCAGGGSSGSPDGSDGSGGSDGTDDADVTTGSFRLLISDAPADIADFDRLDVTLDEARVFQSGGEGEDEDSEADEDTESPDDDESDAAGNETDTEDDPTGNETDTEDDAEEEVESEDDDSETEEEDDAEGSRGYTVVDLEDATVDLTQVIEDDAIAVFDGEIPAGSYEKIELEVSAVQGIVDGGEVDVKLPSEKLQITNGFEVTPDGSVSFVFDINVVKRGPNNGYILKPVISGSGVAGRDVEVNEIDDDDEDDEAAETDGDESSDDGDDTDESGSDDDDAGNETAETDGDGS
ncbi:DUF4382 domain-containing protein [Halorubrum ejinorense]